MLLFQWNALRQGDTVSVHDDAHLDHPLERGTVRIVETRPSGNDIAIQLDSGVLARPRRGAVHTIATGSVDCWRCRQLTAQRDPRNSVQLDADVAAA